MALVLGISPYIPVENAAEGGTRTHTSLQTTDFKSVASTIPPPRLRLNPTQTLVLNQLLHSYIDVRCFSHSKIQCKIGICS
jgi:hypothetical protein